MITRNSANEAIDLFNLSRRLDDYAFATLEDSPSAPLFSHDSHFQISIVSHYRWVIPVVENYLGRPYMLDEASLDRPVWDENALMREFDMLNRFRPAYGINHHRTAKAARLEFEYGIMETLRGYLLKTEDTSQTPSDLTVTLAAAQILKQAGLFVSVYDLKPYVARAFVGGGAVRTLATLGQWGPLVNSGVLVRTDPPAYQVGLCDLSALFELAPKYRPNL